jgi:hypothetical protein
MTLEMCEYCSTQKQLKLVSCCSSPHPDACARTTALTRFSAHGASEEYAGIWSM